MPTLIEVAGIHYVPSKPWDGVSLKDLLTGEPVEWKERLIFNAWRNKVSVRSQRYRLDHQGNLFDMEEDPGQQQPINNPDSKSYNILKEARQKWIAGAGSELPVQDKRGFIIGHSDMVYTQLPARDGIAHGSIQRSNKFPNCSFFTNWLSVEDSIHWEVEVPEAGTFEVELFYCCSKNDLGSVVVLTFGENQLEATISKENDPPLHGMERDLYPRKESYVKEFVSMKMGKINLAKGQRDLTLKARHIPGKQVMDFRLLLFKRIDSF